MQGLASLLSVLAVDRLTDGCQRCLQRTGVPLPALCHFDGQEAVGEHRAHHVLKVAFAFEDGSLPYVEVLDRKSVV